MLEDLPDSTYLGVRVVRAPHEAGVAYVLEDLPDFEHLRKVDVGDEVFLDNTPYLAFQTYHRHQVPAGDESPEWDQFRAAGRPIYPQRPQLLGPRFVRNNGAGRMEGRFAGKMIVVQSLFDEIAYPQQVEWYRRRVQRVLGDRLDDQYRVWFTDHAMHQDPAVMPRIDLRPDRSTRIVNYRGVLEQALRDVAAWAERGIAPPPSTNYTWVDGEIELPATAAARRGIQPVVQLSANEGARADVTVGEPVAFAAVVEVPPGAGTIVAAEWDFEGHGDFPVVEAFQRGPLVHVDAPRPRVRVLRSRHLLSGPARHLTTARPRRQPTRPHHEPRPRARRRQVRRQAAPVRSIVG